VIRIVRRVFGVGVLLVATTAAPLADAEYLTLSIPIGTAAERLGASVVTAYETDVRRIAGVFDALGLPLPPRMTLHLYPSAELFADGLVEDLGVTPALAQTIGRFAVGVALDDTLLVLELEYQKGPQAWLRLLAHEMAHLAQSQLAGGRSCGAQWLAEGMADWVAYTVLDRLGVADTAVPNNDPILMADLDLDRLAEPRHFLEHGATLGAGPLYRGAFLLVQRLVDRAGFDAVVRYFRACPDATDADAAFERVFGQRPADFARNLVDPGRSRASPT